MIYTCWNCSHRIGSKCSLFKRKVNKESEICIDFKKKDDK